jgi:phenylalanine-4-hydroxylase
MTELTHSKIPGHLKRYIVDQNYARYTSEDQAVWRYIMRQLKSYLSVHAHEAYAHGLEETGISIERIPSIDEIDAHLEKYGWGAVPVSGFIPPAAFMEFQAIGVLPIASDMRTINHLLYTPAPDIVHEAAGHAPILIQPDYARYLRQYGAVARHSIISKEDMDQYEAIRILSDIKEDPRSTPAEISKAERRLNEINAAMKGTSEAALLSRMNWWTAEYGLIGDIHQPRIFGAGLLSSVGEARNCLSSSVKKIPLSVDCVNFSYDITEQQPQLFVTTDFAHLGAVLDQLAERLAYRRGGIYGLECARGAATVNSVQLNSGLQISGCLKKFDGQGDYLYFEGPTQLSYEYEELDGQGVARHGPGFSTPVGLLRGHAQCLSVMSRTEQETLGLKPGARARLDFVSGVIVEGRVKALTYRKNTLLLITWEDCRVHRGGETLYNPAWGEFDMAVGSTIPSVFGGPADRERYGQTEDFAAKRIPLKQPSALERKRYTFYEELGEVRRGERSSSDGRRLAQQWLAGAAEEWLPGLELLEISYQQDWSESERALLLQRLDPQRFQNPDVQQSVRDGVALAKKSL